MKIGYEHFFRLGADFCRACDDHGEVCPDSRAEDCDSRDPELVEPASLARVGGGEEEHETMATTSDENEKLLKAAILAAGQDATTAEGQSLVLKKLGEQTVLQCVVQNALQVVAPSDVHVVVGYRQQDVRSHLGPKFHYVEQEQPRGTGDAVRRVCETIPEFDGNLLILYGDTPLFRPASIRGLLNRHRLEAGAPDAADGGRRPASAVRAHHPRRRRADHRHHRGDRGVGRSAGDPRAQRGRVRRECAGDLPRAGEAVAVAGGRRLPPDRLRAPADPLGLQVESYQIYDQDEVQGINTDAGPGAGRVHPAEAAVPAAAAGGAEPDRVRHRRLAGDHRRRLHAAQRAAACRRRWPTRSRGRRWRSAA